MSLNGERFNVQTGAVAIEEIYQELLDGKRIRFPANALKEDDKRELSGREPKYLTETILKWNKTDIKQILNKNGLRL
ncbi:hypothetical protein BK742_17700 [Bacillus thuringiensis serovar pingluonsis]|uniref:Uncharacterized protein n=1 Tax=Bacillus thuringiensis serovar pingluonsis TaxID=180881 RepID=A0A243B9T2_BACTU|nr:hypothetical protein BK742_17700 [Bacillus thuringiensis serovar pingluonsis]